MKTQKNRATFLYLIQLRLLLLLNKKKAKLLAHHLRKSLERRKLAIQPSLIRASSLKILMQLEIFLSSIPVYSLSMKLVPSNKAKVTTLWRNGISAEAMICQIHHRTIEEKMPYVVSQN